MSVRAGVVSVILVNFRGADDTIAAVRGLRALPWPQDRLEIVVVENGSGDESAERIAEAVPDATLVRSRKNLGFAGGSNLGAAKSSGEYLAFLNNDARPDSDWIEAAVHRFEGEPDVGAVASRVLDWEGERVDFIGAAMTWYGMGYKPLTAEAVPDDEPGAHDVLFGTGSAMFVRRSVFELLGGFDEKYFMFFEDVDLGWRLNLRGWRYAYEPRSVAFHKHHASMAKLGSFKETYLLERNALFTLYKNADDDELTRTLAPALMLSARRAIEAGEVDSTALDIRSSDGDDAPSAPLPKVTAASLYAMDQFVEALPWLRKARAEVQATRTASPGRIQRLFGDRDAPAGSSRRYLEGYEDVVTTFQTLGGDARKRILIITGDPIGTRMAGPAIRAWRMARALSAEHSVTLASLTGVEDVPADFDLVHVAPGSQRQFAELERAHDIIVFQGHAMALFDALRTTDKIVVVDIYDPMHLEQLEQGRELGPEVWARQVQDATDVLNEQLLRGDFFLCASERQKHFYLGQLAALGRLNPATYADDADLSQLLAVVPFGLDENPPVHERAVLKGVKPGIGPDDTVLIWSGGLYNWFDPLTLIRAVAAVSERHPGVRLFFQGTKHPHPGVPEMGIVAESRALARELGVLDTVVFFNDSWVPYADRGNYLAEASAGVSTHHEHVETTFSFRTRILDYLWAELPMVVTRGDYFAELVERERLGIAVPAEDSVALAAALERVLFDDEFAAEARANVARVREDFTWERALSPLVQFARAPHRAGDRAAGGVVRATPVRRKKHGLRHDLSRTLFYLRNGGPAVVWHKVTRRLNR